MKEGRPSITAVGTAINRAVHQVLDDEPKILPDPIALPFVEGLLRDTWVMYWPQRYGAAPTAVPSSSQQAILDVAEEFRTPMWKLLRSDSVVRSRFTEDCLAEAAAAGVRQCVILGAGLDSFAYRQPSWAEHLRIFEVDHPATQHWKREHLVRCGIEIPGNLEFCPVDFETRALADSLAASSFDLQAPTFFSWLGVTMYLTLSAIEATFRFVLSLPRPSEVVFNFSATRECISPAEAAIWAEVAAFLGPLLREHGEPPITRFAANELQDWLTRLGFAQLFFLSAELATARYFGGRRDGLRALESFQLVRATV